MISTGVFFQQGFHSTDLVWGGGGGGYRMGKNQACTLEDFTGLAGGVGGGQDGQKNQACTLEEFTGLAGGGGGERGPAQAKNKHVHSGGVYWFGWGGWGLAKTQHALGGGQFTECP